MLCQVSDVIRVIRQPSTPTLIEEITPLLQAVDEWVHTAYDAGWDQTANSTVTETFYNVYQDALINLKDINPTNVTVTIYPSSPSDYIADLFDNSSDFDVMNNGQIRLTSSIFVTVPGFPYVWAQRFLRQLHKVVVTYTASGTVPYAVREAVAMITAATYAQQPNDITNMRRENMAGYSYETVATFRDGNAPFVIPPRARKLLQPYLRGLSARAV
jgi:hypothetical protein